VLDLQPQEPRAQRHVLVRELVQDRPASFFDTHVHGHFQQAARMCNKDSWRWKRMAIDDAYWFMEM
jgi:hypothetical protein